MLLCHGVGEGASSPCRPEKLLPPNRGESPKFKPMLYSAPVYTVSFSATKSSKYFETAARMLSGRKGQGAETGVV